MLKKIEVFGERVQCLNARKLFEPDKAVHLIGNLVPPKFPNVHALCSLSNISSRMHREFKIST